MANDILIIPASASIEFSGSAANTIRLVVEDSGSVAFYGNSGSLFGISDSLSGSLMSVNDISGFPILEVTSDDTVTMGTWNQNTLVVTGSLVGIRNNAPTHELSVTGDISASGDITASAFSGDGSQLTNVAHPDITPGSNISQNNSNGTVIQDLTITLDGDGHVTTATAGTVDLDGRYYTETEVNTTFATKSGVSGSFSTPAAVSGSFSNNAGTVTSITAGAGLNGGTITDSGTISVNSGSMLPYYSSSIFSTVSGDVLIDAAGAATIQANSVALSTDTTGDFVNSITGGTGIDSTGATSGENISHTLTLDLNELGTETTIAQGDFIAMVDITDNGSQKITFSNLEDEIFGNVSGDILIAAGGSATIQANSVALSTDTTGDFVNSITGGTGIASTGATSGENITHTLSIDLTEITVSSGLTAADATTLNLDLEEIIATDGANRVLTSDGDGTLTAESALTVVAGHVTASGDIKLSTNGARIVGGENNDYIYFDNATDEFRLVTDGVQVFAADSTAGLVIGAYDLVVDTNTLFVDASTDDVGIGTTSPLAKLDVSTTANDGVDVLAWDTTQAEGANLRLGHSLNNTVGTQTALTVNDVLGKVLFAGSDGTNFYDGAAIIADAAQNYTGANGGTRLEFYTTPSNTKTLTQQMMIDESGNVGIGTTAPDTDLVISSSNNVPLRISTDAGSNARIAFAPDGGGDDWSIGVQSSTQFTLYDTVNAKTPFKVDSNSATDSLVIDATGNVGIGIASPTADLHISGSTADNDIFHVQGGTTDIIFASGSGNVGIGTITPDQALHVVGEIVATGEITAFYSSDERLKENIQILSTPLTKLTSLRGVEFDWTDEHIDSRGGLDKLYVQKHDVGVIAQEVEKVLPEVVVDRDDGYKAVRYEKMIPLLIEAIKELKTELDEVKQNCRCNNQLEE